MSEKLTSFDSGSNHWSASTERVYAMTPDARLAAIGRDAPLCSPPPAQLVELLLAPLRKR